MRPNRRIRIHISHQCPERNRQNNDTENDTEEPKLTSSQASCGPMPGLSPTTHAGSTFARLSQTSHHSVSRDCFPVPRGAPRGVCAPLVHGTKTAVVTLTWKPNSMVRGVRTGLPPLSAGLNRHFTGRFECLRVKPWLKRTQNLQPARPSVPIHPQTYDNLTYDFPRSGFWGVLRFYPRDDDGPAHAMDHVPVRLHLPWFILHLASLKNR